MKTQPQGAHGQTDPNVRPSTIHEQADQNVRPNSANVQPNPRHNPPDTAAQTLRYYTDNADSFTGSTACVDFSAMQDTFIEALVNAFTAPNVRSNPAQKQAGANIQPEQPAPNVRSNPANIHSGLHILDFGCGSGRDAKYFIDKGFTVSACDGSPDMCRYASSFAGITVKQMLFSELTARSIYHGIWACSSILHLPPDELKNVFIKKTAE